MTRPPANTAATRAAVRRHLVTPAALALVLANLVPLIGVFWLGWDAFSLLLLFWLENLIIGFFNILRMLVARGGGDHQAAKKIFMIPFFTVHYGGFTFAHGVMLFSIFADARNTGLPDIPGLAGMTAALVGELHLGWPLLALCTSHGISFVTNSLLGGEYKSYRVDKLLMRPYGRVIIMHIAVLLGAFLAQATGNSRWALVILVGLKIAVDLRGHLAERRVFAAGETV